MYHAIIMMLDTQRFLISYNNVSCDNHDARLTKATNMI